MAKSKEEQIFIGVDDKVIELTGADKETFIAERDALAADFANQKAEQKARKAARLSALQKLGLTEEEINAIL